MALSYFPIGLMEVTLQLGFQGFSGECQQLLHPQCQDPCSCRKEKRLKELAVNRVKLNFAAKTSEGCILLKLYIPDFAKLVCYPVLVL